MTNLMTTADTTNIRKGSAVIGTYHGISFEGIVTAIDAGNWNWATFSVDLTRSIEVYGSERTSVIITVPYEAPGTADSISLDVDEDALTDAAMEAAAGL